MVSSIIAFPVDSDHQIVQSPWIIGFKSNSPMALKNQINWLSINRISWMQITQLILDHLSNTWTTYPLLKPQRFEKQVLWTDGQIKSTISKGMLEGHPFILCSFTGAAITDKKPYKMLFSQSLAAHSCSCCHQLFSYFTILLFGNMLYTVSSMTQLVLFILTCMHFKFIEFSFLVCSHLTLPVTGKQFPPTEQLHLREIFM